MKQERIFKFSFDAFVEQKEAAGMVATQTVVYLFFNGSSKPAAPALTAAGCLRAPPKLAAWTTTHVFGDLGFVQHTCSPLSLCAE